MEEVPSLRKREIDGHKGDFGKVFVVAGSKGMVGAALLCAESMLRSGAGYVKLGMPWRLTAIASANPFTTCVLTSDLPETEDGTISMVAHSRIIEEAEGYDVMAMGPGLSRHKQTLELVRLVLSDSKLELPAVLDADALYAFVGESKKYLPELFRDRGLPILTPHPGEFKDLAGLTRTPIDPHVRAQQCRDYAGKNNLICVLKGHHTVVSNGERTFVSDRGNCGMATAGSGDVLTGCISALVGQGYDSFEAAVLGVHLHASAGDLAAASLGPWGMTAHDILNHLPKAFMQHWYQHNPDEMPHADSKSEVPSEKPDTAMREGKPVVMEAQGDQ